jgi:hypothetical protein
MPWFQPPLHSARSGPTCPKATRRPQRSVAQSGQGVTDARHQVAAARNCCERRAHVMRGDGAQRRCRFEANAAAGPTREQGRLGRSPTAGSAEQTSGSSPFGHFRASCRSRPDPEATPKPPSSDREKTGTGGNGSPPCSSEKPSPASLPGRRFVESWLVRWREDLPARGQNAEWRQMWRSSRS